MPGTRSTRSRADSESSLEASCRIESASVDARGSAHEQNIEHTGSAPRSTRFGRYRIVCELASGGMATVNLAIAEGIDKLVALKVIHPHLAKEESFLGMFLDEARIASGVLHRNVCNVFDYGEHDGRYYMAMDYLAGRTLGELIRRLRAVERLHGGNTPLLLAYIVAQACEGLHAAHELRDQHGDLLDVVHRDVSPHNLLVTYDGHVSVIDFGIARAADRLHHTAAGVLKGKFSYMAPEQLRQTDVDRRVDVWGLGVCLWEALTRRRLFARAVQADTLMSVLTGAIPPPSEVEPSVPAALDRVVMRALARPVDQRYPNARELGRDLIEACREHGGAIGSVEIEDFMAELFDEEIARARQLELYAKQIAAQERAPHLSACAPRQSAVVLQLPAQQLCQSPNLVSTHDDGLGGPLPGASAIHARMLSMPSGTPRALSQRAAYLWASLVVAGLCVLLWTQEHGLRSAAARREVSGSMLKEAAGKRSAQAPETASAAQASVGRAVAPEAEGGAARRTRSKSVRAAVESHADDLATASPIAGSARGAAAGTAAEPVLARTAAEERPMASGVSFAAVRTAGALVPSVVSRMLARATPLVRECLDTANRTGYAVPASVPVWFSIDESGAVREGGVGAQAAGALATCVMQALKRVRSDQRPESGVVAVAADLKLHVFRGDLQR
jgi:serine/threonine-protein kinase